MQEHLDATAEERRATIEEKLGASCCKTNRRTGKKECGKQHCPAVFKKKADAERFAKKYKAAKTNPRAGTKSTTSKRKRSAMTKRSPRTGY